MLCRTRVLRTNLGFRYILSSARPRPPARRLKSPRRTCYHQGTFQKQCPVCSTKLLQGPGNVGTTTKENYRSHRDGNFGGALDFSTYSNFIALARKLGFQYVWIESLCIIQQTSDFDRQTSKMGRIYKEAHLVVAAGSAPGIRD